MKQKASQGNQINLGYVGLMEKQISSGNNNNNIKNGAMGGSEYYNFLLQDDIKIDPS